MRRVVLLTAWVSRDGTQWVGPNVEVSGLTQEQAVASGTRLVEGMRLHVEGTLEADGDWGPSRGVSDWAICIGSRLAHWGYRRQGRHRRRVQNV